MTDSVNLLLTPPDNTRLANLCGAMDENINHIARALSVVIKRRGENFQLSGESAALAADTLRMLYLRADKEVVNDDVRLQLAQQPGSAPVVGKNNPAAASKPGAARNEAQKVYWEKINRSAITLCTGPAGTGKTHIAVAAALRLLRGAGAARRLVLSRPVVEAGGERLGFLPGDMEQKINPYLRPLYEVLYQLQGKSAIERRIAAGEIEILPLAFMRGLTLNNTVLILDEAQNTTPAQMRMLLTRLGENSKIIITGDTSQSDLPALPICGLTDAAERLAKVSGIALHHFQLADIVRSPLVRDILKAYDNT
ncbi:MAG: PhoH family protein [Proteobacteria bacterium]|nr:PhoH family protein [Pseudomonadota bacterium]